MAASPSTSLDSARRFGVLSFFFVLLAGGLVCWFVLSYVAAPDWWKHRERLNHPALDQAPKVTVTSAGIPGDPLNLFIVGSEAQLVSALLKGGWYPADPVTLKTSLRIAEDSVLHRPYEDAPVSALMLFGRKQDMAFEKPAGDDPSKRHHVRLWQAPEVEEEGQRAWWGAVTFDRSEGLSHTTGEITHHIAANIDQERDLVLSGLRQSVEAVISYRDGFQDQEGKNGGGDPWRSDGRLGVVELAP